MSSILISARTNLSPEMVGIESHIRTSSPGLSRRQTADLVGISVSHYQRIEQCTSVGVSADVVDKICTTLQMTTDENTNVLALHNIWASSRRHPISTRRDYVNQSALD